MYGKTTNSQQFITRSAMHSTKGSRRGFDLLDQGENAASVLSAEEKRISALHAAKARLAKIQTELANLPRTWLNAKKREYLGQQMLGEQACIHDLKASARPADEVSARKAFIEAAKEFMTKEQYLAIWERAHEMMRKDGRHGR